MEWMVWCTLLAGLTAVMAQDPWPLNMYPNPRIDPDQCRRSKPSFVCDPDQILTEDQANQLDALIEDIRNNTNCPCSRYQCVKDNRGYQIGISLVSRMEVPEEDSEMETVSANLNMAKLFAYTQLSRWENMGQCDENVMIFYSVKDNVLYTMTGEIARKKLNNQNIGYISLGRRREFGMSGFDAYYKALRNMLEDYRAVFNDDWNKPDYADSNRPRTAAARSRGNSASSVLCSTVLVVLSAIFAHKTTA